MTSKEKLIKILNNACDELLVQDADGSYCPPVCLVCDKLLKYNEKKSMKVSDFKRYKDVLITKECNSLQKEIKDCYRGFLEGNNKVLQDMSEDVLLSPRSVAIKSKRNGPYDSLIICKDCKRDIERGVMPKWAIANGYFFGTPPKCISELTEIERAFITPVKSFGYVYVWTGGPNQKLKGTLAYIL